jgi:FtsH-binding integral membrane protein
LKEIRGAKTAVDCWKKPFWSSRSFSVLDSGTTQMSIFEITMLVCFGAGWPVSIRHSYRSRTNAGKSLAFLIIVLTGYLAGILHKVYYSYDAVIYLYMLNGMFVSMDILLYFRNRKIMAMGRDL